MNSDMVLHDIMDQFDIEENFEYCFSMYCNYLEREGKWKFCENNSTKNNYKYRMRKQYKGDIDRNREYIKFENWIEKRKIAEQKEVERTAKRLGANWEKKCKELEKENEEIKKQLESLKQQLKDKDNKYENLLNKYLMECDSDSDSD